MDNTKIKKYIGAKIKRMRQERDFTQEHIAGFLKLSRVSVLNIESGRHSLTFQSLLLLCSLFKCTPNDLLPAPEVKNIKIQEKYINIKKKVKVIKVC